MTDESAASTARKSKLDQLFGSDEDGAENGKWVEIRPGIRFKLRSVHSKHYRREEAKQQRKNRSLILQNNGILDPETEDETQIVLLQRSGVVDWDGDGLEGLPFTVDNLRSVLKKYPALRREVLYHMRVDETFRAPDVVAAELDKLAGN